MERPRFWDVMLNAPTVAEGIREAKFLYEMGDLNDSYKVLFDPIKVIEGGYKIRVFDEFDERRPDVKWLYRFYVTSGISESDKEEYYGFLDSLGPKELEGLIVKDWSGMTIYNLRDFLGYFLQAPEGDLIMFLELYMHKFVNSEGEMIWSPSVSIYVISNVLINDALPLDTVLTMLENYADEEIRDVLIRVYTGINGDRDLCNDDDTTIMLSMYAAVILHRLKSLIQNYYDCGMTCSRLLDLPGIEVPDPWNETEELFSPRIGVTEMYHAKQGGRPEGPRAFLARQIVSNCNESLDDLMTTDPFLRRAFGNDEY